eukprot:g3378.t1
MASEGGQPAPSMCRVLYDFDSPADDEISLETGEVITVTQRDDGGWWRGEKVNGEVGLFPFNYVELIETQHEQGGGEPGKAGGEGSHAGGSGDVSAESDSVSEGPNRVSPSAPSSILGTEEGSAASSDRILAHAHVELSSEQEIGLQSGSLPRKRSGFMAVNFHAPDIMSIDIISTELVGGADSSTSDVKGKKFTLYNVQVTTGNGSVRIAPKRYSEFRALQEALRKTFPVVGQQLQTFMQSKMKDRMEHFRRFNDDVVNKRKVALKAYLQAASNVLDRAVAIQDWMASDATELTLKKGDEVKIYRYMLNGWVEAGHIMGLRGMCPESYLRKIDSSTKESEAAQTNSNAIPGSAIRAKTPTRPTAGIEKFQLTSLEAFDQLMEQGYAVEIREKSKNSDNDPGLLPSVGDQVEVELVGMIWDASQTLVTEFFNGDDISTPYVLTVGEQQMTEGLDLALTALSVDTRAMVVVAPHLAYKEIGEPLYGVPASVHVVFDVRIVKIIQAVTDKQSEQTNSDEPSAAPPAVSALQPLAREAFIARKNSGGSHAGHTRTSSKGGLSLERKCMSPNKLAMQHGRPGRVTLSDGGEKANRTAPDLDLNKLSDSDLLDRAAAAMGIHSNSNSSALVSENSSSKPENSNALASTGGSQTYTLNELISMKTGSKEASTNVDRAHLEKYLSSDEFQNVFGMSQAAFSKLPKWKQKTLKQNKNLF